MNEPELRRLMASSEWESVEFKPGLINRSEIAEYCVGIGNSGGGWLIIGVSDKLPRHIVPMTIPQEDEISRIRESVADASQIHIDIQTVQTSDGPVLTVRIPARPQGIPFHTRNGKYLIRLGEGLRGMTLPELDAIRREAGIELTARPLSENAEQVISPSGIEELRRLMKEAGAASDLVSLTDQDLLRSLGVLMENGDLLIAGLLLAGKPEVIRRYLPGATWQFRRMKSDTDYEQADEGTDCLPIAIRRLREFVAANNPVVTIPGWLVHPEFPRYPVLALRELIVNALVHQDYEAPGAVTLKLYPNRLELSNPGGFIGGVSAKNILHHPSTPRYPVLFQALTRMRLANASNLGVPRIFRDLLREGKEPPDYWSSGGTVRVTIKGQEARREFLELVKLHPGLDVDDLLVLHFLTRHREMTAHAAAEICQRSPEGAREILANLATKWGLLESGGGAGRGRYYRLSRDAYSLLVGTLSYRVDRRLAAEDAKGRVLSALSEGPLSNAEIREITRFTRYQTVHLMNSLRKERLVEVSGVGRKARWFICAKR